MAWRASCFKRAQSTWLGVMASMQQSLHTKRILCTDTTATNNSQINPMKIFLQHTFYKGKSALSFHPGKPNFKRDEESGTILLEKEGSLFLTFTPSTGPRQYDWGRKQIFALSIVELGGLLSLTASDNLEFYHDPHLGTSNAGKVRKCLKVEGMPDKSGFFFNMVISDKLANVDERFAVPVTKAEFAVMRSSFSFIIPYLMGWHALTNPASIHIDKASSEVEWAK